MVISIISALLLVLAFPGLVRFLFLTDKALEDRRRAAMTEDERKREDEDQAEMSVW